MLSTDTTISAGDPEALQDVPQSDNSSENNDSDDDRGK